MTVLRLLLAPLLAGFFALWAAWLALAADSEVELFRASAWPLEAVADPTGAGDTFLGAMAGYLAAQGAPPYAAATLRQAIVQGSMLASFTCEAFSTRRLEALSGEDLAERLDLFRAATHW